MKPINSTHVENFGKFPNSRQTPICSSESVCGLRVCVFVSVYGDTCMCVNMFEDWHRLQNLCNIFQFNSDLHKYATTRKIWQVNLFKRRSSSKKIHFSFFVRESFAILHCCYHCYCFRIASADRDAILVNDSERDFRIKKRRSTNNDDNNNEKNVACYNWIWIHSTWLMQLHKEKWSKFYWVF